LNFFSSENLVKIQRLSIYLYLTMYRKFIPKVIIILSFFCTNLIKAQTDQDVIKRFFDESLTSGESYWNLEYLSTRIGGRLAGSPQAAAAIEWTRQLMTDYNFDTVFLQPFMATYWKRGEVEVARITGSASLGHYELNITSLGNSVGTGKAGVNAPLVEVRNFNTFDEMEADDIRGKIVFFNEPFDPTHIMTFRGYGQAVQQRSRGASMAAAKGAVAVLVRSITPYLDDHPHTGALRYDPDHPEIPAMAVSTEDAELLSELLSREKEVEVYMENYCELKGEVLSYNVIGELRGLKNPDEYIVVGGHLDAWDNGQGAHDDGSGCMQSIEVLRLFKELGIRPNHTLRAVMFMNEENGLKGGKHYAAMAAQKKERHVAALESDAGGFVPIGFNVKGEDKHLEKLLSWKELFEPYNVHKFIAGGGGADISPLAEQGVPLIGHIPDPQRYFELHHTAEDTFDKINRRELEMGAASMASLIYLIDKYGLD
jgi:hypothetical protein